MEEKKTGSSRWRVRERENTWKKRARDRRRSASGESIGPENPLTSTMVFVKSSLGASPSKQLIAKSCCLCTKEPEPPAHVEPPALGTPYAGGARFLTP